VGAGLAVEDECLAVDEDEGSQMLKRMKNSSVSSVATRKRSAGELRRDRS
jgi:hypothetical protein